MDDLEGITVVSTPDCITIDVEGEKNCQKVFILTQLAQLIVQPPDVADDEQWTFHFTGGQLAALKAALLLLAEVQSQAQIERMDAQEFGRAMQRGADFVQRYGASVMLARLQQQPADLQPDTITQGIDLLERFLDAR